MKDQILQAGEQCYIACKRRDGTFKEMTPLPPVPADSWGRLGKMFLRLVFGGNR